MQTETRVGTALGHGFGVAAQAVLVVAILAALVVAAATVTGRSPAGASAALAGGKASPSWISLASTTSRAATQPTLGSLVAFDAGYPNTVKNPRIEVLCYQGGALTYGEAGGVNDTFQLGGGGSIWLTNGGSADCVANLYYFGQHAGQQTYNRLASTSFSAG